MAQKTYSPKRKTVETGSDQIPILKSLRERKKISRAKLSKLTQLTPYQVEGLEGERNESALNKTCVYIKALGFNVGEILHLINSADKKSEFPKGTLAAPLSETSFSDGIKFLTYHQDENNHFCRLQLAVGKSLERTKFPESSTVFGIVREGTLVIDTLVKETIHKKDHFFILPGNLPVNFINGDSFIQTSALLFFIKSAHLRSPA